GVWEQSCYPVTCYENRPRNNV
ncbi:MAG: hypothetical protein QOD01_1271, partial [Actinomycetota bacterium]|nr:hypothetical protein [Actinomycetota bacterium]